MCDKVLLLDLEYPFKELGAGNSYLGLSYEQGVKPLILKNVILPGIPCWDSRDPSQVEYIRGFLNYNQQMRLEVSTVLSLKIFKIQIRASFVKKVRP